MALEGLNLAEVEESQSRSEIMRLWKRRIVQDFLIDPGIAHAAISDAQLSDGDPNRPQRNRRRQIFSFGD
jgi:hypothetical protein